MTSNASSPRRHSPHQSIPLQDLSRPPDISVNNTEDRGHRRSISGTTRTLLGNRQSFRGRVNTSSRYERVAEASPTRHERSQSDIPHITTPRNAHQPHYAFDDGELSPRAMRDFQAAVGGLGPVGITFGPPAPAPRSRSSAPFSPVKRGSTLGVITETAGASTFPDPDPMRPVGSESEENYISPTENDRTPLTDSRFLQPIGGASLSTPSGQRHNRQGSRLGDDLNLEAGLRPTSTYSSRSLSRSLSTSSGMSPLTRAGTMVRKMSQRVVNLSNEPDPEPSIRRQPDSRQDVLEGPPSFPAMEAYAHDEPQRTPKAVEKVRPLVSAAQAKDEWQQSSNPLRGKSLGTFSPENKLRLWLCEVLVHPITEPVILVFIFIQTFLLAIDSAPSLESGHPVESWQSSWLHFALLVLFIIYTLEICVRCIVSGFVMNPDEYSNVSDNVGNIRKVIVDRIRRIFRPSKRQATLHAGKAGVPQQSIVRSFTGMQMQADQSGHSRHQQRVRLARRAFLRHGFNRLDFLAVVSFWISFVLEIVQVEQKQHIYVFRMLSCLRILRLLGLTSGTSVRLLQWGVFISLTSRQVILRSLKKAAPLLVNVAFLIGFFWLLFAIVGIQLFKGSFKRTCVWYDPLYWPLTNGVVTNETAKKYGYALNDPGSGNLQLCGGHFNATDGKHWPWRESDLVTNGTSSPKGYICPRNSICVEDENPYNGTVSFDNVGQSLQLVFVIMSSNTFSDLMYYTTDSDRLASAVFFAFGIVIMSFWLMNLLVAVITSSFQVIREESKGSAFTAEDQIYPIVDDEEPVRASSLRRWYDKTYWVWIAIIVFGLVTQSLRSADMGPRHANFVDTTESVVTLILFVEIVVRFAADWRNFHRSKRNWVDLGIAVITAIIQIPPIRNSGQPYAWLTFFQILRFYRVVLAVSITRDLIQVVLGNVSGLLNLIVFVFLITFLTAIFAVQILRGEIETTDPSGEDNRITFSNIYNSFIGMYQVLSSENWTSLMYSATSYESRWNTSWISATFFILWFILANFIVLNMFIAVIQESFDVTEDEKRLYQVRAFLQQSEIGGSSHGNLSLSAIFRLGRGSKRHIDPLDFGPATTEMLVKETVLRDFLDELEPMDDPDAGGLSLDRRSTVPVQPGLLSTIWGKLLGLFGNHEPNPFYSRIKFSPADEKLDPRTMAREVVSATEQRKRAQRQYLQKHPTYNTALFLLKPSNRLRRFCQRIVGPGRGTHRYDGVHVNKPLWYGFSAFIYAAIVVMVTLACVSTPLYQREYFKQHGGFTVHNWFLWTDMSFAIIFSLEALIKVIADGFFWTPNAYFRGSWGFIDGLVLVTLWINVSTSLYKDGAVSRTVGAFKALRALRLLNVSDSARDTFHSVIVLGGWKVLSAAFVSLSLLVPFAIYGLNLFNGQFEMCNDTSVTTLDECVGEYASSLYNWTVITPRQVSNPYYHFDDFGSALSILFQIVSQEGWTDVMWSAMMTNGRGNQPRPFRSQGNAVFFIIFNLLGAVFVLTLFLSVFMRNYTEQTGVAFFTAEQRSWLELRKLLRQIAPSKRPSAKKESRWRGQAYRIAVKKKGRWSRFITFVLTLHLILLVLEFSPETEAWELTRDWLFLAFTLAYIANIVIRIIGLTWKRFHKSSWDMYSIASVAGTVITALLQRSRWRDQLYSQLHHLFLVSIALLLIPRNNQLDQLFKTAAASLPAIGNLMATWFVLFLVYAIALTQTFGLTKFGPNESGNLNFRNVPKALILLFRMSCGEGWNAIMEDYASIEYPNCNVHDDFLESDCGSAAWARALFISWNILSMYIFVSLFVSLIFESFSYVYQKNRGLSYVSREEVRRFKEAWATYDPEGTGYISKEKFPRLLGELSGVFEMRIYDGDHSVRSIVADCKVDTRGMDAPPPGVVQGVDLDALNRRLATIDVPEIRRRRKKLELFFQEIMVSADVDRGINFTSCLMILAHYNIISDGKSLKLDEYLRRRARIQRVEESVERRVVRGFFDTMYWNRRFRSRNKFHDSARMVTIPQFAVPEIFVDDRNVVSPLDSQFPPDVPPKDGSSGSYSPQLQQDTGGLRRRNDSFSVAGSPSRSSLNSANVSPQLSPHRPSVSVSSSNINFGNDGAMDWIDEDPFADGRSPSGSPRRSPARSRANSNVDEIFTAARSRAASSVEDRQRQDVLDVFDNSAWGESIRRSFTLSRRGTQRRGGGGHS
ncbi:MAG: hypothetical protein LQ345_002531 [Seirophora villosa]|nr:MAG: hypothetical protein LQ345_002531 [Seirophora villosa]